MYRIGFHRRGKNLGRQLLLWTLEDDMVTLRLAFQSWCGCAVLEKHLSDKSIMEKRLAKLTATLDKSDSMWSGNQDKKLKELGIG